MTGTGYDGKKYTIDYGHLFAFVDPSTGTEYFDWNDLANNSNLIKSGDREYKYNRKVNLHEPIARSGGVKNTPGAGSSKGAHLHFTISTNGTVAGRIDPEGCVMDYYHPDNNIENPDTNRKSRKY